MVQPSFSLGQLIGQACWAAIELPTEHLVDIVSLKFLSRNSSICHNVK